MQLDLCVVNRAETIPIFALSELKNTQTQKFSKALICLGFVGLGKFFWLFMGSNVVEITPKSEILSGLKRTCYGNVNSVLS